MATFLRVLKKNAVVYERFYGCLVNQSFQNLSNSSFQNVSNSRFMSTNTDAEFEQAREKLFGLTNEPPNDVKLKIYALFKQATLGQNTTEKPSSFNFVAQAKWTAWNSLGNMSAEEAKKKYIEMVTSLTESEKGSK